MMQGSLLPRWVRLQPDEPPHGILLRLAECNALPDMDALQFVTGLSLSRIKAGENLMQLADVLHCDVNDLRTNATSRKGKQAIIRRQILSPRPHLNGTSRQVCSSCLRESSYHRVWWDLTFVTSCPIHNCKLTKRCSCGSPLTWKDGSPSKCRLCENGDVRVLPLDVADPQVTALDRWVMSRFVDHESRPTYFIDALPLGYAIEFITRVGALDIGGYRLQMPDICEFGDIAARARGFQVIVSGSMGSTLDQVYQDYLAASTNPAPSLTHMYGWFYFWFNQSGGPRLSPRLGEIILQNASKKIQVTRRAFPAILRDQDDFLTLGAAASLAKVRPATMRQLLASEGCFCKKTRRGIPVRVSRIDAERIAAELPESLTLASLRKVLGISATAMIKVVRSELIPVWVRGGCASAHRYLFRRTDVSRWLETIIGSAPTLENAPANAVSLSNAPSRCNIAMTVLVRAIIARELKVIAVVGDQRDFQSAWLAIADVSSHRKKIGAEAAKDPISRYRRNEPGIEITPVCQQGARA